MSPNINESMTLDEVMTMNRLQEEYKDIPAASDIGMSSYLEYLQASNEAFNQINKYIMVEEVKCFRDNHTLLFEGTTSSPNVFKRMLDLFVKFLERIRDAFASAWKFISEKLQDADVTNKAFLMKYKKHLAQIQKIDDFEGYDFSGLASYNINFYTPQEDKFNLNSKASALSEKDLNKEKAEIEKYVIGQVCANPERFLNKTFYGSEDKKKKKHSYDIKEQIQIIDSTHRDYKTVQSKFIKIDTTLKGYINFCKVKLVGAAKDSNMAQAIASKEKDGIKVTDQEKRELYKNSEAQNLQGFINTVEYAMKRNKFVYDLYCAAIINRNRQAKAICIKAMQENPYHENAVEAPKYRMRQLSLNDIYQSLS